jgi:hypothetical protein
MAVVGTTDELTLWGLWVGIVGCGFVVVAVFLMTLGFSPGSRRYPNPGGMRSPGWDNYLRNLKRVNLILLAGATLQFISILLLYMAAT